MGSSGVGKDLQAHNVDFRLLGTGIGEASGMEDRDLGGWAWSEAAWGWELSASMGIHWETGLQVEHGTGLLQEAQSVYLWLFSSRWVRVWTNLRVEKPHYSDQEEEKGGKCELTGSGGGWGEQGRGPGVGPALPGPLWRERPR